MPDYNPDHYRFRRSGNLEDDPQYRRRKRWSSIWDLLTFWGFVILLAISLWMWH